jgi:hypothetical protein
MHEATIAGSERIGHNTSGGIEIATSSRIEIMVEAIGNHQPLSMHRNRCVPDLLAALDELARSAVELGDDATAGVPCRSTDAKVRCRNIAARAVNIRGNV